MMVEGLSARECRELAQMLTIEIIWLNSILDLTEDTWLRLGLRRHKEELVKVVGVLRKAGEVK